MAKQATVKTPKTVTVLNVYKFKSPLNRICFETLSSDEITRYHTCFDGSADKSSCTCPGGESPRGKCYHQDQLRSRAAEYFAARQPESDETPGLDAAEAHINQLRQQVAASKQVQRDILAAPLNNQSHKMEVAPSGRLVPMR